MKLFEIEIRETLSKIVTIEAHTLEEALAKTNELYGKQEIVLSELDFIDKEIIPFEAQ